MRTAIFLAALVALPFLIYLSMSLLAATMRVFRGGQHEAREFSLARVDLAAFLGGKVKRLDGSSLIPTRAGVGLQANADGSFTVRETRTISKDVF